MVHISEKAGWTAARQRRLVLITACLVLPTVAVIWAAFLPWAGLKIGAAQATCEPSAELGSVGVRNRAGDVVQVRAAGCVSAYQAVQSHQPLQEGAGYGYQAAPSAVPPAMDQSAAMQQAAAMAGMNPAQALGPGSQFGLPSGTFYAAAAAVFMLLAGLLRNALPAVVSAWFLNVSYSDFAELRSYLMFGMDGFADEMGGVVIHQLAYWSILVLCVSLTVMLLKVNAEQRKLDGAPAPWVKALSWIQETIFRVRPPAAHENQAAAS